MVKEVPTATTARGFREIAHGDLLAHGDADAIWGWRTPAGQRRFRRRAQLLLSAAAIKRGDRLLELGCGTGLFTEVFAQSGAELVALDISPDLLNRARDRTRHASNVSLVLGQFETHPIDGVFDAVVGSSVLHHLALEVSLARCYDVLKPGGRLVFAEPNLLNPQVLAERVFRSLPPFNRYVSPDETAFVRFSLTRTLARAGFHEVRITPFDFLHPATPRRLVNAMERIGRACERVFAVRELAGSLLIGCRKPGLSIPSPVAAT